MAVDRGYGSGYRNTGMAKPASPKAASANLRKKGVKAAAKKYTSITTSKAKSVAGSSDYVQRENAARTQLGTAGVAARARQLPTAARAFTREMTGIDVSRKGVSVDPLGVAMALPVGKVLKAAKVLRAAGQAGKAAALEARIAMKDIGREIGKAPKRGLTPFDARYVERGTKGTRFENMDNLSSFERKYGLSGENRASIQMKKSASVYPKISSKERAGIKPKTSPFVEAYGKRKLKAEAKKARKGKASSLLAEYLPGLYD